MKVITQIKTDLSFSIPSTLTGPNIVTEGENGSSIASGNRYKLSELSAEMLDSLCEEFRVNVFKKAGKDFPVRQK